MSNGARSSAKRLTLERIKKVIKNLARLRFKSPDWVRYDPKDPRIPPTIYCKKCGLVIRWPSPDNKQYLTHALYREIRLKFDDGSNHITPLCNDCLKAGLNRKDLEAIYCLDLLDLIDGEERNHVSLAWELMYNRTPTKWFMVVL